MKVFFILFFAAGLFAGCAKDDEFSCDKNTSFSTSNGDKCAHGRVTQHSKMENYERFILAVSNSTLNFELRATNENGAIEANVEYTKPFGTVVAQWVMEVKSAKIVFTKVDREAGKISGEFQFEVDTEEGIQRSQGRFTDIDF